MSLFGEFHVPAESFTLFDTLQEVPELTIEIERVVASDELLTPYFWGSCENMSQFEAAVEADPTVDNLHLVDEFEEVNLYRANWTGDVESVVFVYTELKLTVLEATGQRDLWQLQIRFDNQEQLEKFQESCSDRGIPFELQQLHEVKQPRTGSQYDLTSKQHDALRKAWEMGYYTSTDVTLTDIAAELDVTQQSISQRLQRGIHTLIENTIMVTPPSE